MTLTDFLLARIAEDEERVAEYFSLPAHSARGLRLERECKAKRRLIDWAAPVTGHERTPTDRPGVYDRREVRYVSDDGEDVLCYLAAVYADHPDYREEWMA